ncbi:CHAT domain-containing protein [Nostoc sp. UHCC 0702]|nr:CHAT domain-containing protein [Nostoc sp. UHCC 0702]
MIFLMISTTISIFSQFTNKNWISFIDLPDNKVLAQTSNNNVTTNQNQTYNQILKTLAEQNRTSAALEFSERIRARAFVNLLSNQIGQTSANPPNIDQIKQIAKQQKATLVQYTIVTDEINQNNQQINRDSELYIWVIRPTGEVDFQRVDLKPLWQKFNLSLSDFILRSREKMGVSSNDHKGIFPIKPDASGQQASPKEQLQQLHEILIAPIAKILPKNSQEHVIFIPQGELFLVPFAALQDRNGKYLIEKHTINIAPSIQVLDLLYQQKQRIQGIAKDVLIVGNPTMPSIACKPGETPRKLSPLPGAEQEAKAIAEILHTQALTGNAATETAVVQRMREARIIHLATQGVCNHIQGTQTLGALVLAPEQGGDSLLTYEEILNLNLKAELVVLSANDTALGKITGDGVIGLSRSFFVAGVPSIVGSLWDVSDKSTVLLMTEFYQKLSENPDKASALRHAMLATRKKYPNLRDWAAFTLIGVS